MHDAPVRLIARESGNLAAARSMRRSPGNPPGLRFNRPRKIPIALETYSHSIVAGGFELMS
jgi:hypothetical protein